MRRVVWRRQATFANPFIDDLRFVRKLVTRRQNDVILLHSSVNQKVKRERESDRMIQKTKNNIRKADRRKKQRIT